MRTIIAGSRRIKDEFIVFATIDEIVRRYDLSISEVVCGMADGPDKLGREWGKREYIPVSYWPACWDKHGKQAGILRNEEMGNYADVLIGIWDGESNGTAHMIFYMKNLGKPYYIYNFKEFKFLTNMTIDLFL